MPEWNKRYLIYAQSHLSTPEDMMESDRWRYPGGKMCGYLNWINESIRQWKAETGHVGPLVPADHMRFDVWLQARLDNWLRSEIKGQETS